MRMRIGNRLKFLKGDPLRHLHVPKRKRLDDDGPQGQHLEDEADSNAFDEATGDDTDFDREEVRNRGNIVSEEWLQ